MSHGIVCFKNKMADSGGTPKQLNRTGGSREPYGLTSLGPSRLSWPAIGVEILPEVEFLSIIAKVRAEKAVLTYKGRTAGICSNRLILEKATQRQLSLSCCQLLSTMNDGNTCSKDKEANSDGWDARVER